MTSISSLPLTTAISGSDLVLVVQSSTSKKAAASDLTPALNTFTSSAQGVVPASGGGTTTFLRADGTWASAGGGGTWGSITGTLSSQSDLNTALAGKAASTSINYVKLASNSENFANTSPTSTVLTATSTGATTLDSTTLALNDTVLLHDQTNPQENGLYTVTTAGTTGVKTVLTRTTTIGDTWSAIQQGGLTFVTSGGNNAKTIWICTNSTTGTLGTTGIAYTKILRDQDAMIDGYLNVSNASGGSVIRIDASSGNSASLTMYAGGTFYAGLSYNVSNGQTELTNNGNVMYVEGDTGLILEALVSGTVALKCAGTNRLVASSTGVAVTGTLSASGAVSGTNIPTRIFKTADQSVSSTVSYVDDNTLAVSLATGTYIVNCYAVVACADDAPGYTIKNTFTGSLTTIQNYSRSSNASVSTAEQILTGAANSQNLSKSGGTAGTSAGPTHCEWHHRFTVTGAGTWKIQFSQSTSNANAVTVKTGSYLEYYKIA